MNLDECFALIGRLSPNAAKLAARMLRRDPSAPTDWAFALEVGLADRAQGSDPFTTDDLLLIAMDKDPKHFPTGPAAEYNAQQIQAIEFVVEMRRQGQRLNGFIAAPRRSKGGPGPVSAAASPDSSVAPI
ncbi:hypothetical protein J7E62_23095 [Variovorax paradoxus]|nr:hypothetical protein [Variovorax paradoxus]